MIGGDLPLILPSELGGYWIDPPLERLVDVSPTSSHSGLDPEGYDIMERDGEAKIYQEFFCSRVRLCQLSRHMFLFFWTGVYFLSSFCLVPSLIHSSGSIFGASGSLCLFGGWGEQAAGDTKVEIFIHVDLTDAEVLLWKTY